jgi:hypothetical protein
VVTDSVTRARHIRTLARAAVLAAAFGAAQEGSAAAAEHGLVGAWHLDEPEGQTVLDDGPFGLDGQLGTAAGPDADDPSRIAGVSGSALRFAAGSFVRLPDAPELAVGTLTIEAVVRASGSPGGYRYVVSRGSHGCLAGSYGLYTAAAGGIAIYAFDGSRYVVSPTARPQDVWDGAWHHVAGTFDEHVLRVYVDGRPVGTPTAVPLRIDYATTTASAALGRYVGTCDLSYRGDLDLARLWSRPLGGGEIADAAQRELRPGEPPSSSPPPPLPAADPTTTLPGPPPASTPPPAALGAPPRACALRLSRSHISARRRTSVRVWVTLRGRPVPGVRVVARRTGRSKPITQARTGRVGHARLRIRVQTPGRVRVSAAVRPSCRPRFIRVAGAR